MVKYKIELPKGMNFVDLTVEGVSYKIQNGALCGNMKLVKAFPDYFTPMTKTVVEPPAPVIPPVVVPEPVVEVPVIPEVPTPEEGTFENMPEEIEDEPIILEPETDEVFDVVTGTVVVDETPKKRQYNKRK